jgi:TRAP-type mannitol/chloroaromatic compound transport system substrate-binding protein
MPEKTWAALSNHNQAVLETACGDTLSWTAAKAAVQQVEAIAIFRSMGVELHAWPDEVLLDLREAWNEIIAEEIARDPLLAEAWTSYLRFRDGYGDWQARAYAK